MATTKKPAVPEKDPADEATVDTKVETPEVDVHEPTSEPGERIEYYDARRRDGVTVRVKHNIDTGTTEIVE